MKEFVYLIQGQSHLIEKYLHLAERAASDAIILTYDKPVKGATFSPNSTWAQGRNKLLELALNKGRYHYYIFCDDDIEFITGGWEEFEGRLKAFVPAVGVPLFYPKTNKSQVKGLKFQSFLINDEQLMAFHHEVVADGIVLPYQERFDHLHWWAACEIQEILIQNFYPYASIQFNDICVSNEYRHRYLRNHSCSSNYKKLIREWLSVQFHGRFRDIYWPSKKTRPLILWRMICFLFRRVPLLNASHHRVNEVALRNILSPDSEILAQYLSQRSAYTS